MKRNGENYKEQKVHLIFHVSQIYRIFDFQLSIFNCFVYLSALNQFMWKWHYSVYLIRRKRKALIKG